MAAWPNVVSWLVTTLPTLPGWAGVQVYDGKPNTGDDPTNYVSVGWSGSSDTGGQFVSAESPDGFGVDETGHVLCDLVCQDGGTDLSIVRTAAFALVDALRAHLKSDRTLGGVLSVNGTVSLTVDPLNIDAAGEGVAQALMLTFGYTTVDWT